MNIYIMNIHVPYFLDWNARVLLVSNELLAGVVFEGAFYSRARSIPFSLSVTKIFSKHNNFKFKGFIIMFSFLFIQHTMSDSFTKKTVAAPQTSVKIVSN